MTKGKWCAAIAFAALLMVPLPAAGAARSSESQPEREVREAAGGFIESFNNLDWEKFSAFFAIEAKIFHPFPKFGRRISGRDEIVASFKSLFEDVPQKASRPPHLNIQPKEIEVQMLTEAAIVTFHLPGEKRLGRRTLVFQKRQGRWLIVHLHASNMQLEE